MGNFNGEDAKNGPNFHFSQNLKGNTWEAKNWPECFSYDSKCLVQKSANLVSMVHIWKIQSGIPHEDVHAIGTRIRFF